MAGFFIPLTGLNADSTALNTIANNLTNMNTTAFKSQSVNFSDLFALIIAQRAFDANSKALSENANESEHFASLVTDLLRIVLYLSYRKRSCRFDGRRCELFLFVLLL